MNSRAVYRDHPCLIAIQWGWLPALIWILGGALFIAIILGILLVLKALFHIVHIVG